MEAEDFHNYKKRLVEQLRILNESAVSKANKEKIFEYYNYIQARGLSPSRMFRSIISLRQFALFLKKPFEKATEKEMQAYVAFMREKNRKPSTIETNVKVFKVFYKWIIGSKNKRNSQRQNQDQQNYFFFSKFNRLSRE